MIKKLISMSLYYKSNGFAESVSYNKLYDQQVLFGRHICDVRYRRRVCVSAPRRREAQVQNYSSAIRGCHVVASSVRVPRLRHVQGHCFKAVNVISQGRSAWARKAGIRTALRISTNLFFTI
jgi:hypothetical protein